MFIFINSLALMLSSESFNSNCNVWWHSTTTTTTTNELRHLLDVFMLRHCNCLSHNVCQLLHWCIAFAYCGFSQLHFTFIGSLLPSPSIASQSSIAICYCLFHFHYECWFFFVDFYLLRCEIYSNDDDEEEEEKKHRFNWIDDCISCVLNDYLEKN